ncbi:hypothetical protein M378DRAFT_169221 [Amanita muscaria Koide BX008]|uniref:Uncharacterized protein n=1 Tax=Amanita muscaria (strain Koide BX008) TaxID=946122 RepID=A0A0C2S9G5_AMAMK|nr:hypothetical protein M378DRAFT_169221 [Amanita muscaria Koide BX008]
MKTLSNTIEKIPGLRSLLDKISDTISVFVLTTIEVCIQHQLKGYLRRRLKSSVMAISTKSLTIREQ